MAHILIRPNFKMKTLFQTPLFKTSNLSKMSETLYFIYAKNHALATTTTKISENCRVVNHIYLYREISWFVLVPSILVKIIFRVGRYCQYIYDVCHYKLRHHLVSASIILVVYRKFLLYKSITKQQPQNLGAIPTYLTLFNFKI